MELSEGELSLLQVMDELKQMGTSQNVKVYQRHGAGDSVYGVSFANLGRLRKKIGRNHELALALWESGNMDARTLATMVVDVQRLTPLDIDKWMGDIHYYVLVDLFADALSRSPFALEKMKEWMKSKEESRKQCGYSLLASMLKNHVRIGENEAKQILETIEREIHSSPNRARHAMNMALIAIGVYQPDMTELAIDHARKIGKVEVDHGETRCRTPDAEDYIRTGKGKRRSSST